MTKQLHPLNFVTKEERQEMQKVLYLLAVQKVMISLSIFVAIFALALFGVSVLMDNEFTKIKKQNDATAAAREGKAISVEKAIQDLNKTTQRLEEMQKNYIVWSKTLSQFIHALPEGVAIQSMTISSTDKNLKITGTAKTRDAYNALRTYFENANGITGTKLPVTLAKEDIPFSATLTLLDSFYAHE